MTRVVVAHDYCTQRGGAERVALTLLDAFPGAPLVTAAYNPSSTFPGFAGREIRTSWLQRVGPVRRDPRLALPLLPAAWETLRIEDADVVVCSSTGWAHGVPTEAPKLVYCHNPARWLYQADEYLPGQPTIAAAALRLRGSALRRWDQRAARSASRYLANSSVVAARIRSVYGIEADVLPPPVSIDPDAPQEPVAGLEPGFLLTVARGRSYKNVSVVCKAVEKLPGERLVAVGDLPPSDCSTRISAVGTVSDAQLRWLYANARALVSVSYEDFGLTPLEANALGTPAVLLRAGGFLDTLVEGVNGWFVERPDVAALVEALQRPLDLDPAGIRAHAAAYSRESFIQRIREAVASAA